MEGLPKGVVILLWYLGVMAPLPAPDGWKDFGNDGLTIHVPPGWEMVELEERDAQPLAGFEPRYRFAAKGRGSDGSKVTLGKIPLAAKIGTRNAEALLSLEVDRPGMVARALQRTLPGWTCTVASTVYDQARHRLWFRIEARREGQPGRAFVFAVLMARGYAFYFATDFPVQDGDEAPLEQFRGIVNSFEFNPSLRRSQPGGALGANPASSFRIGFEIGQGFGQRYSLPFLVILLVVLIASLLAILDPLVFRRRLKAALIRRLQVLASRTGSLEPPGTSHLPRRMWYPPLPWALAVQIVFAHLLPFVILPWFQPTPQLQGVKLFTACYLLGYGLFGGALALHYAPRTSRRLKYELLAAALSFLALPGTLVDPQLNAAAVGLDLLSLQGLYWGASLMQVFYFYLAGLVVQRLLKGPRAAARAAWFYRSTYWLKRYFLGLVASCSWFPVGGGLGLGFALLAVFYLMGEKARERPILYLRSFHDPDANLVLAKILMPTAGRFAPVLAVAHDLQPPEEMHRKTNMVTAAQLTILPDPVWREWILAALPHCRAVLIDTSVRSDSLLWELEQARAVLPPERVAVLLQGGDPPPHAFFLRYGLDWRGRRAARKALRRWLKKMRDLAPSGRS